MKYGIIEKKRNTWYDEILLKKELEIMTEKKRIRTESDRKNDKKYNEKRIPISIGYTPVDIAEGKRLKAYLAQTDQSANSYIKGLIKADLDSKGVPYDE